MVTEDFEAQLRSIVREEMTRVMKTDECAKCALCREPGFADKHKQHHRAFEEFLDLVHHLNDAKWSTVKAVLAALTLGLIMAFLYFFFGIKQP